MSVVYINVQVYSKAEQGWREQGEVSAWPGFDVSALIERSLCSIHHSNKPSNMILFNKEYPEMRELDKDKGLIDRCVLWDLPAGWVCSLPCTDTV